MKAATRGNFRAKQEAILVVGRSDTGTWYAPTLGLNFLVPKCLFPWAAIPECEKEKSLAASQKRVSNLTHTKHNDVTLSSLMKIQQIR